MTDRDLIVQKDQALELQAEQELAALLEKDPNLLKMLSHGRVDGGDLAAPPICKLAQDQDPEHGIVEGDFFNTLTWENYGKTVEVVPLINLTKTRANYHRPYKIGEPPYCASDDAKKPRESTDRRPLTDPSPGPCKGCSNASWDDGTPLCSLQHNFLVAPFLTDMPEDQTEALRIMWQKTGVPTARQFRSFMVKSGITKTIVIGAVYKQTDKGKYWEPTVMVGQRLSRVETVRAAYLKIEGDNMVKDGFWHIGADEVSGFDEDSRGEGEAPSGLQDDEPPMPKGFDGPEDPVF